MFIAWRLKCVSADDSDVAAAAADDDFWCIRSFVTFSCTCLLRGKWIRVTVLAQTFYYLVVNSGRQLKCCSFLRGSKWVSTNAVLSFLLPEAGDYNTTRESGRGLM
jgi:hypothetical protein